MKFQLQNYIFQNIYTIFLIIGLFIPGLNGLLSAKDVSLTVPTPIKEGDDAKLICQFSIPKNVSIYTVKWYKGNREIFRYFPKDREKKTFPFGPSNMTLIIDEPHSDMHTLILKRVPVYMTGNVSCEVTPEPPYNLVTKTSPLLVVVPPRERPKLVTSLGLSYLNLVLNHRLTANCTSSPSKPAANITFFINDFPVQLDHPLVGVRLTQESKDKLEIESGELEVQLSQKYFINGKIRIRCTSRLFNIHEESSDEFYGELTKPKSQKQGSILFGTYNTGAISTKSGVLGSILLPVFILNHLRLK